MMKRILCYGDSNTWGAVPRWKASPLPSERYDNHTRWPRVMADDLGPDWEMIEEGLGGRTTIYHIPDESHRLGSWYMRPCLLSHRPLDYVVIMLGTNDLQPRMHKQPFTREQMYEGPRKLIEIVRSLPECGKDGQPPKILLIAPPTIKKPKGRMEVFDIYGREEGIRLSQEFASVYYEIAQQLGCGFLDAGLYAAADDGDGVHFSRESHPVLGHAVASAVREMEADASRTQNVTSLTADIEI